MIRIKKHNLVVIHTYVCWSGDHSSQLYEFGVVLQFTVILMHNKKMFSDRDYEELDERGPFSNNKWRIHHMFWFFVLLWNLMRYCIDESTRQRLGWQSV